MEKDTCGEMVVQALQTLQRFLHVSHADLDRPLFAITGGDSSRLMDVIRVAYEDVVGQRLRIEATETDVSVFLVIDTEPGYDGVVWHGREEYFLSFDPRALTLREALDELASGLLRVGASPKE